jgi:Domain of unknown function (DUF6938)
MPLLIAGNRAMKPRPSVVSVEMGYGHLRAALPLAEAFETELLHVDRAPFADSDEAKLWARVRRAQEVLSKPSQVASWLGGAGWMDKVTNIPSLYGRMDQTVPTAGARVLDLLVKRGLGRGLMQHLEKTGAPLVTTFYAPAIIADAAGYDRIYCVVTDADINRVWAPMDPSRTTIHYFAPSPRVVRRLVAYGVPRDRISLTGFPLPTSLLGDRGLEGLRTALARRLVRLDPHRAFRDLYGHDVVRMLGDLPREEEHRAPTLTFAVGGAGAQADMADEFLPSLKKVIAADRLKVNLIAGTRNDVAEKFRASLEQTGMAHLEGKGIRIVVEQTFDSYYARFNELLLDTDILWTKPSELSFYAALGLPLVIAKPVGSHERYNRRWLREQGVALKQHKVRHAADWLEEWLEDGTLAAAAWTGFLRMSKEGTYRILEHVENGRGAGSPSRIRRPNSRATELEPASERRPPGASSH